MKYPIILHKDNSSVSVANARELIDQVKYKGKWKTTQHLVRIMNLAVALLQDGQYYEAKSVAEEVHNLVVSKRGPTHELVAFTATTCANCCGQLAAFVERELACKQEMSMLKQDQIEAPISKALTNERFLQQLRLDEARFREIAKRIVDMPDHWYMKSPEEQEKARTSWDDSDSSRSANASNFYERARAAADAPDDGYERFSEGWKERRKGSYHQQVRRSRMASGQRVPR